MTPTPNPWRRRLPLILVVAAALAGALLLREHLTFDALRDQRAALLAFRDANPVATAALFIAAYVAIVALSLPGAALASLTGGFLFGVFPGTLYNVLAATIGAVGIFTAVRLGLGDGWKARIDASDGAIRRVSDGIRDNQVPVLLAMRLIPGIPFFVGNLIPAFLGIATWRFAWTTFVGILPGAAVYTWVGSGLDAVLARGEAPDLRIIFEPQILFPILALAALSLVPVIVKAVRRA